ncbi:MAG: small multi-drug export protein [Clostridiales bacterium]|nr:small multi-drug export protein [Clostridiales bacterium]
MNIFIVLLVTFAVAAVPIIELKGAIPLGMGLALRYGIDLNPWVYFIFAYLGSCLPAPFIIMFLRPVLNYLAKTKLFRKLSQWLSARFSKKTSQINQKADQKSEAYMEKLKNGYTEDELKELYRRKRIEWFKYISLFLFVAVPLPLTGCWTGSGIAAFMGLNLKKGLPIIFLGNLVAGLLIMFLSLAGFSLPSLF